MVRIEQLPALGTYWWFELFDADETETKRLTALITDRLQSFNDTYSRFNQDSLVYRLNTEGFLLLDEVANPEELLELLAIGVELYEVTDGVFNFLTAAEQVAQGYGGADSVRPAARDTLPNPLTDLVINTDRVTLLTGAIDMGGFAKGWLIDDLAADLLEIGSNHFLINGGGDMFGTTEPDGAPIEIIVEHPATRDTFIAKIPLLNQGFAASSTLKRTWEQNGETKQHILKTHEAGVAAHVVAKDALTADVFATLACILDPKDSPALLAAEQLDYLIMVEDQAAMSPGFEKYLLQ